MKVLFTLISALIILALASTTQTLVSCTKEVHDTAFVYHNDTSFIYYHDTTFIYYHDTVQVTLESCCNPDEGYVNSYFSTGNGNGVNQVTIGAWTHSGSPENARTFMKFSYSDIPSNSTIISAKLSLYHMVNPGSGNFTTAHSGSSNAFYIRRITSSPLNTPLLNWSNQPTFTTQNQVLVPQTISDDQDDINLDVTDLVKDMMTDGNNGFFMQLQNETIYNIRQYCSSFYEEASQRPKLVIQYKKG